MDAVLKPSTALLLGEMHGTAESQAFVATAVCRALQAGLAVTVGLEVPYEDQGLADAYLRSGREADRRRMLASPFWTATYQDGRRSEAMAGLIDRLRAFRADGLPVRLVLFDRQEERPGQTRDDWMAARLSGVHKEAPADLIIALAGNLHTRVEGSEPYVPMGVLLGRREPALPRVALNVAYSGGTAWTCASADPASCQIREMRGRAISGEIPRVEMLDARHNGYDGEYLVDVLAASPPAVKRR